jgi:cell wall-associated NlpC family hydrolase
MTMTHATAHFVKQMTALFLFCLTLFLPNDSPASGALRFAVATLPTPVFSTPDIDTLFGGATGGKPRLDRCGQMRELEFVALPGTVFTIEERIAEKPSPILRVTTADYPYPAQNGYFIDARFVEETGNRPTERVRRLSSGNEILAALLASVGSDYVWGGNVRRGIPEMGSFYPPATGRVVSARETERRQLEGVDCSGLLYEATGGYTPRNTSALVAYGRGVRIAGLSGDAIAGQLEPLDLIVWNGHVIIVLDRNRVIESRLDCDRKSGVVVTPLKNRLAQIMKTRQPADDYLPHTSAGSGTFVVRRWFDAASRPRTVP